MPDVALYIVSCCAVHSTIFGYACVLMLLILYVQGNVNENYIVLVGQGATGLHSCSWSPAMSLASASVIVRVVPLWVVVRVTSTARMTCAMSTAMGGAPVMWTTFWIVPRNIMFLRTNGNHGVGARGMTVSCSPGHPPVILTGSKYFLMKVRFPPAVGCGDVRTIFCTWPVESPHNTDKPTVERRGSVTWTAARWGLKEAIRGRV
jgi:hypothetical protein